MVRPFLVPRLMGIEVTNGDLEPQPNISVRESQMKLVRTIALLACCAFLAHGSIANAQSTAKPAGSAARPTTMAKKEMAPAMSKAFTNGYNVPSSGVAIEGYCPVCYIAAHKAAKGSPEFSYDYEGVTYWFVSAPVRQMFIDNPKKFQPAYGGWCATGVAIGQRFPVDPTNFKVVEGRIMLFLKNQQVDTVKLWEQNEAENLKKADANWAKLKG